VTNGEREASKQSTERFQREWNKYLKAKESLGPEVTRAISQACTIAAAQFREDAKACAGVPRLVEQFEAQATQCERTAYFLEL
jgi:hypothetical protein